MIKRAKTGQIENFMDENHNDDQNKTLNGVSIKDVLEIDLRTSSIDVNLDEEDGDEIAVRV